jgi:hypothetical protein
MDTGWVSRGKVRQGILKTILRHGNSRVSWPVTEHLSTQGRPDPKGGLCCSWCSNKTSTPLIGPPDALKIIKKRIRIEKVMAPKVEGSTTQKNKPPNVTKLVLKHSKNSLKICCSVAIKFKDDL